MAKRPARRKAKLIVRVLNSAARRGLLQFGQRYVACALGRGGITAFKREGDGGTPRGAHALRLVLYNSRRVPRPRSALPISRIRACDGWCDDVADRNYNRPVRHPYPARAEHLSRSDEIYDVIVVLRYNERPRVRNFGSAIFMHVARPQLAPTEGCIALRKSDLVRLLSQLPRRAQIVIGS